MNTTSYAIAAATTTELTMTTTLTLINFAFAFFFLSSIEIKYMVCAQYTIYTYMVDILTKKFGRIHDYKV